MTSSQLNRIAGSESPTNLTSHEFGHGHGSRWPTGSGISKLRARRAGECQCIPVLSHGDALLRRPGGASAHHWHDCIRCSVAVRVRIHRSLTESPAASESALRLRLVCRRRLRREAPVGPVDTRAAAAQQARGIVVGVRDPIMISESP